jgi:hypothetical protein
MRHFRHITGNMPFSAILPENSIIGGKCSFTGTSPKLTGNRAFSGLPNSSPAR